MKLLCFRKLLLCRSQLDGSLNSQDSFSEHEFLAQKVPTPPCTVVVDSPHAQNSGFLAVGSVRTAEDSTSLGESASRASNEGARSVMAWM